MSPGNTSMDVDVLVCGGGMSGMSCATFAAESGAKVLVAEKQPHLGGSSAYSAGMFWAPRTLEQLHKWIPDGEPELQKAWHLDYLRAVQWMRQMDVPTAAQYGPIMTIGIGYPIKIPMLYQLHAKRLRESNTGSQVWVNTQVVKLIQENDGVQGSRIVGAVLQRSNGAQSTYIEVRANVVVMATGGFQGSKEMRARYLGPGADNLFVRSNTGSVGDGLRLAGLVGAGSSSGLATYYGHLMAAPLRRADITPKEFLLLAQYHSRRSILINEAGRRFADESTGDEVVNQYLTKQENRRGFILFDEHVRTQYCISSPFPNAGNIDRLALARKYGCNVVESPTLAGLIEALGEFGVNTNEAKRTIEQYHKSVALGDSSIVLDAPTGRGGEPAAPLEEGKGPFFAMEVQPSITFTYGGISIDTKGHALTPDNMPIPGLLVAGVDAGGFSNLGYAGGLALAFVTGFWAAREAAYQLNMPAPSLPEPNAKDLESATNSRL